jgi:hypothetical protein
MGRPRNKLQQEQDEARESRQACVDSLADLFTDPNSPFTSDLLRECRAVLYYLEPEIKQMMDSICRRYSEPRQREILRAALLATAIEAVNRLICDPPPVEQSTPPSPVKTLRLASGKPITFPGRSRRRIEFGSAARLSEQLFPP